MQEFFGNKTHISQQEFVQMCTKNEEIQRLSETIQSITAAELEDFTSKLT